MNSRHMNELKLFVQHLSTLCAYLLYPSLYTYHYSGRVASMSPTANNLSQQHRPGIIQAIRAAAGALT